MNRFDATEAIVAARIAKGLKWADIASEKRSLMIAALRYLDSFVKIDGTWLFAERLLYVDWLENRPLS